MEQTRLASAIIVSAVLLACDDTTEPRIARCRDQPAMADRVMLANGPFGIAISPKELLYVTQMGGGQLLRAQMPATAFSGTVSVGNGPVRVVFAPNGEVAFVANQSDETVGIIDVATQRQIIAIGVAGSPISLAVSRDGTRAYAGTGSGRVAVIDIANRRVLDHIDLEGEINGLAVHPTQARLYASSRTAARMWEINATTQQVMRTLEAGGVPQDIAISADGQELYLADESGPLQVWSIGAGTRITQIPSATMGFAVVISPDSRHLYVSSSLQGYVYAIDRVSRTMLDTLELDGTPRRIAFAPSTCTAAVANEAGWVDFIR